MDERGMENEQSECRISPNTEYLPTKCRVTKPPPPKPATNPLQFIKVAPPPLFQKAKEQIQKVEKIKKERREVQDETEDWQANLDNWKSSRRKLQEHIIERVVEVKKFEQEDDGRSRRRSKTFNEILEERGKSKYSIPIYLEEANDWNDFGTSDSRSDRSQDSRSSERNTSTVDQYSSDDSSSRKDSSSAAENVSSASKSEIAYNNNNYQLNSQPQLDSKDKHDNNTSKIGQYTYEGAIEGYRSRIKSRIDDSILNKISEMPKRNSEIISVVPKGEIVKRKELFDRQHTDDDNIPKTTARVLQEFENSVSIKQRLKSLEKCSDQTVKYVDNINIKPKVKQISQLFDKPCTENLRNEFNNEVTMNSNHEFTQRREKININIVPWRDRMSSSENSDLYMYSDKNDPKEVESQSDDKSSDTFYSGLEDTNYPPSVSSTDYMALSSDREDSGIHTADVSCSVSQADDTAEEVESNTNSHETVNDDFNPRKKYYKDMEDNNNIYDDHVLKLTEENVNNQSNIDLLDGTNSQYEPSTISNISKDSMFDSPHPHTEQIEENALEDVDSIDLSPNVTEECSEKEVQIKTETSHELEELSDMLIKDDNSKVIDNNSSENQRLDNIEFLNIVDTLTSPINNEGYVFDPNFPLLPTKMVEPPKEKPPPPPVLDDEKPQDLNIKRMNSTKRIKKEITLKRSSFLGLNDPSDADRDPLEGISIAVSEEEQSKVEEILAKQLYESKINDYGNAESQDSGLDIDNCAMNKSSAETLDDSVERLDVSEPKNSAVEEDEITKQEREIIEMVEKAEKFRVSDTKTEEQAPEQVQKPPIPLSRTLPSTPFVQKPADASYYDKKPDYLDDQDSEVLKVEQELQQLEQEELKRKRDNLLFRQACSRVFAKNKRYSLENIFDNPSTALECRKSMPELQLEKDRPTRPNDMFRSIHDVDLKFRKSVPNIPGYLYPNYSHPVSNNFQTIEKYEKPSKFQHDVHRSAFEVPVRKPMLPYVPSGVPKPQIIKKIPQPGQPSLVYHNPPGFVASNGEPPPIKSRNRGAVINAWPKTRPNVETRSYDQHWLYQEAELRRLQDQKNYNSWQYKQISDSSGPNLINRGPILPSHASSKSSIRKLTSVNNDIQPYMEHQNIGPPLPVTQPRPVALEESPNRILSVSGKKKCSFCGNELGRGAAMIIETLCLFYHMECFKCCVCHVQLGNGLNGTDVRVRNQKLHCHNCYSSDDGVKFSCV